MRRAQYALNIRLDSYTDQNTARCSLPPHDPSFLMDSPLCLFPLLAELRQTPHSGVDIGQEKKRTLTVVHSSLADGRNGHDINDVGQLRGKKKKRGREKKRIVPTWASSPPGRDVGGDPRLNPNVVSGGTTKSADKELYASEKGFDNMRPSVGTGAERQGVIGTEVVIGAGEGDGKETIPASGKRGKRTKGSGGKVKRRSASPATSIKEKVAEGGQDRNKGGKVDITKIGRDKGEDKSCSGTGDGRMEANANVSSVDDTLEKRTKEKRKDVLVVRYDDQGEYPVLVERGKRQRWQKGEGKARGGDNLVNMAMLGARIDPRKSDLTSICQFPSCSRTPSYGLEGEKRAIHCGKHRVPCMVNVISPKCVHEGCQRGPSYNDPTERKPAFCAKHRLPGMVNVVSPRCHHPSCSRGPCYGNSVDRRAVFCSRHRMPGMVNVVSPRCVEEGCEKGPSYGFEGMRPSFCAKHKRDGMVNVVSPRCQEPACTRGPSYGRPEDRKPSFCAKHRLEGMMNIVSRKCEELGCSRAPSFGWEGNRRPSYCVLHKLASMVQILRSNHKKQ